MTSVLPPSSYHAAFTIRFKNVLITPPSAHTLPATSRSMLTSTVITLKNASAQPRTLQTRRTSRRQVFRISEPHSAAQVPFADHFLLPPAAKDPIRSSFPLPFSLLRHSGLSFPENTCFIFQRFLSHGAPFPPLLSAHKTDIPVPMPHFLPHFPASPADCRKARPISDGSAP